MNEISLKYLPFFVGSSVSRHLNHLLLFDLNNHYRMSHRTPSLRRVFLRVYLLPSCLSSMSQLCSIIPTIVWPIEVSFAQKSCGLLQEINIDWLVNLLTFWLLEHTFLIHKSRATVIWQIWTESRQASSFHCNYDFSKQKERHRLKERNLKDGVIQVVQSTDGIV